MIYSSLHTSLFFNTSLVTRPLPSLSLSPSLSVLSFTCPHSACLHFSSLLHLTEESRDSSGRGGGGGRELTKSIFLPPQVSSLVQAVLWSREIIWNRERDREREKEGKTRGLIYGELIIYRLNTIIGFLAIVFISIKPISVSIGTQKKKRENGIGVMDKPITNRMMVEEKRKEKERTI